jgi:VanZ family protein
MKQTHWRIATFLWGAYTLYLTTIPNFSPTKDTFLSFILSNGGHFFFFGIFAVLLFLSLPARIWNLSSRFYAVLITSIYGLLIEFVQLNIPGRSFDLKDWVLDTLGAITFLFILKNTPNQFENWRI